MKSDLNKNITSISYNHLNLPVKIVFSGSEDSKIEYLYNAMGEKVQKTVTQMTLPSFNEDTGDVNPATKVITTTLYLNGFQYLNGALDVFPHAQGLVSVSGSTYTYLYQYKDHLGNIRLTYKDVNGKATITDENHYYPLGMKITETNFVSWSLATAQKYRYNGQEWQDELGLNMTAMDFRQYDNAIGRFVAVDPLAELSYSQTPYHFANNNAVNFSDPSGLCPECEEYIKNPVLGMEFTSSGGATYTYEKKGWTRQDGMLSEVIVVNHYKKNKAERTAFGLYTPDINKIVFNSWYSNSYSGFYNFGGGGMSPSQLNAFLDNLASNRAKSAENRFTFTGVNQLKEVVVKSGLSKSASNSNSWFSKSNLFYITYLNFQIGDNTPILINSNSLDLRKINMRTTEIRNIVKNGKGYINLLKYTWSPTGVALGNVKFNYIGGNEFKLSKDEYNFDIRPEEGLTYRNIFTFFAGLVHGPSINDYYLPLNTSPSYYYGGRFDIYFSGTVILKP